MAIHKTKTNKKQIKKETQNYKKKKDSQTFSTHFAESIHTQINPFSKIYCGMTCFSLLEYRKAEHMTRYVLGLSYANSPGERKNNKILHYAFVN